MTSFIGREHFYVAFEDFSKPCQYGILTSQSVCREHKMSNRQLDEKAIFQTARLIENSEGHARYFDQICAGDTALRERVEALLRVHEHDGQFLISNPPVPPPTVAHTLISEVPGQKVGRSQG